MRILLTGAGGQLGQAFLEVASEHAILPIHHSGPPSLTSIDLQQPQPLQQLIQDERPDWVLHAAALTNVDECERNPGTAQKVNAWATGEVAKACKEARVKLLYVSTDYVFEGTKGDYREEDATNPVNEYGRSKLAGEQLAIREGGHVLICRTSVVFGPHKNNFVRWCTRELGAERRIRVVTDQRVCPSYTYDLAQQLLALMSKDETGIYHTAGATPLTRHDMAQHIAQRFHLDASLIDATTSDQLAWIAQRPHDTTLSTKKISRIRPPMGFDDALDDLKTRWTP